MDEYEEQERLIRRLERERVAPPPKSVKPAYLDDSPQMQARRRKVLEEAAAEHENNRPLRVVGE